MSLEQYLESIGYDDYEITITLLYYDYGFTLPEQVHNDVMYWLFKIEH